MLEEVINHLGLFVIFGLATPLEMEFLQETLLYIIVVVVAIGMLPT
jgi:hypothetical protein